MPQPLLLQEDAVGHLDGMGVKIGMEILLCFYLVDLFYLDVLLNVTLGRVVIIHKLLRTIENYICMPLNTTLFLEKKKSLLKNL